MPIVSRSGPGQATDYVLVVLPYADYSPVTSPRAVEYFTGEIEVSDDIAIGPIAPGLSEAIITACSPRHENYHLPTPAQAAYALWRRHPASDTPPHPAFDADNRLATCVLLSRLVHPTAIGFQYAARVRTWGAKDRVITALRDGSINPNAFVIDTSSNWLVPTDIPALAYLFDHFYRHTRPNRINSALWYSEYAARSYFIDFRWPQVVTGLEALVKIYGELAPTKKGKRRKVGSTESFVSRLSQLGQLDRRLAISEKDLTEIYDTRSVLTHGQPLGALDQHKRDLYAAAEQLLRGILFRAIVDTTLGSIFASDASIQSHLPVK